MFQIPSWNFGTAPAATATTATAKNTSITTPTWSKQRPPLTLNIRKFADRIACLRILLYNAIGDKYGKLFTKRKHPCLNDYDYSTAGAYFITIRTQNHRRLLSNIVGRGFTPAEIQYTTYGKIAEMQLFFLEERYPTLKVDQYVIMPNHIHAILFLEEAAGVNPRPTITDIVCAYKSLTTKECKKAKPIDRLFQTSFYEHVIRGQNDYDEIAEYIANNPKQWELDKSYAEE